MCQPQSPSGASTPSRHHVPPSSSSPHSGPGIVRQMTDSVEPTSMAAAIVVTFVVVQFRIVLKEWAVKLGVRLLQKLFDWWRGAEEAEGRETGGRRGNGGRKVEPKNNSERRASKRFADKQVGSDLDAAVEEEQEHTFERAPLEVPYHATVYPESEMVKRSQFFYESLKVRRSVRCFSPRPVPPKVVQNLIKTAGTAPSGANLQPWTFCVVQSDRIKRAVREVVEEQEQLNYSRRMGVQWVLDIAPLNVNWNKPYLTEAPFLIVVMKHAYQLDEHGERRPTYYSEQSTAIAVGILLAAIQNAGLVTVVTTPLNAGAAIREILQRPINEKVSLLLPLGYPAEGTFVPDIRKKPVEEIMRIY